MDLTKYKIHRDISVNALIGNGFLQLSANTYMIHKNLYNNIIILNIYINLATQEIEFDVVDKYQNTPYIPFWNNINGENNLVALKVINNFEKYMKELQDKKIIKISKSKKGGEKNDH